MRSAVSVAIAGGGVGGLVAAAALRNAGAEPVILERAPDVRQVQLGGSIHLWPNGMRALGHAGLADAVRASVDDGAVMKRQTFQSAGGRMLVDWDLREQKLGLETLAVIRGELHEVLARESGDMLELGSEVVGFESDDDGVTVRLGNGSERRFDVLVGADGLRSRVREGVAGDRQPVYTDYTTWLSVIPMRHPLLDGTIRVYFGRGGRFVAWPVTGGRVYWEGIYGAPAGGADSDGGRRADVLERYGDWAEPIRELVEATPEERIVRADSYALPVLDRWRAGRVVLLGDAAHGMTNAMGQGANQAIEDAIVLARCLERNSDAVAGLSEYESLRRPRTTTFVKRSKVIARTGVVHSGLGAATRDVLLAVGLRLTAGQNRKDMAYDAGAA